MIRRRYHGDWLLIPPSAHAAICGSMAGAWGNPEFDPPKPRSSVVLAASEHDAGWQAWEEAPALNPEGEPRPCSEAGIEEHVEIRRRCVDRLMVKDPYAALLVSLHGTGIFRGKGEGNAEGAGSHSGLKGFLSEQVQLQRQIRRNLREDPDRAEAVGEEVLMHHARLLELWDYLSLILCAGDLQGQVLGGIPGRRPGDRVDLALHPRGEACLLLKPYPFGESPLVWQATGRVVRPGPHRDPRAFEEAYRWARLETISLRVERGSAWSGR